MHVKFYTIAARAVFCGLFLFATVPLIWARPPSGMELSYDFASKTLHIELEHVTKNPRDHHIRKIVITKNDEEIERFYFVTQTTSRTLIKDVALDAQEGDEIGVQAYCNEAGRKKKSLVITEEE